VEQDWGEAGPGVGAPRAVQPDGRAGTITAARSGYLQFLDVDGLLSTAAEHDLVLRLEVRPGGWVQEGGGLFAVWPARMATDELAPRLRGHVTIGPERSIEQDAAFGIRQLVDVAVKAISPSVNDPTTATDCLDRIGQILVAAGRRREPARTTAGRDGAVRLIVPHRGWDELVALAFDQVRQYGAGSPDVSLAMAETIASVTNAVPRARHPALLRQAGLIREAAVDIRLPHDRARVLDAVDRIDAASAG
jgi:uncharacterized membrane protein